MLATFGKVDTTWWCDSVFLGKFWGLVQGYGDQWSCPLVLFPEPGAAWCLNEAVASGAVMGRGSQWTGPSSLRVTGRCGVWRPAIWAGKAALEIGVTISRKICQ